MIDKIETNQIGDILEKSSSQQHNTTRAAANDAEDVSLQVDYASFIDQAKQIPETDTNTVQQTQELLASGQLESPKNIRAAAENILTFGI